MYTISDTNSDEKKQIINYNYLIYCGVGENEEIIPCSCLETVLKIATIEKQICRIFKRAGSLGKKWDYMCDISVGVL